MDKHSAQTHGEKKRNHNFAPEKVPGVSVTPLCTSVFFVYATDRVEAGESGSITCSP